MPEVLPVTKICTKCKVEKSIDNFLHSSRVLKNGTCGYASECKECHKIANYHWEKTNREKRNAIARHWYQKHKNERRLYRYRDLNRFKTALATSRHHAKKRGFISCSATAEEIKSAFTGYCHICGVPEIECTRKLSMDHDHATGQFRGWLCGNCNHILGKSGDSSEHLLKAARYLKKVEV